MQNFIDPSKSDPLDSDDSSESIQALDDAELNSSDNEADETSGSDDNYTDIDDSDNSASDEEPMDKITGTISYSEADKDGDIDDIGQENDDGKATDDATKANDDASKAKDNDDDDENSDLESDAEATMEEIFGIKPNKETIKNHPPKLTTDTPILDICFHPETEIIAAGNICGECILYRYSLEEVVEVKKFIPHDSSCRQICFNDNGSSLYTVSNDKSIALIDVESSKIQHLKNAHEAPIYSFLEIHKNLVATGDDDGLVKLWDVRGQKSVMEFQCSEETVTSLLTCDSNKFLTATCADGSLTGLNIRRKKLEAQSEMYGSEFTCQSLVRTDSRLAVGSGSGIFYIFNWGDFGYNIDALSGHPEGISCQAAVTDRIVITGCNDGIIRATHLYPHRFIGIIGQHKDFAIDNLAVSHEGFILASCSSDDTVQFWNIEYLYDKKINPKKKAGNKKILVKKHLVSSRKQNPRDFFNDIPRKMNSDDEGGPVPGGSYDSD